MAVSMKSFHPAWKDVHLCGEMHGHVLVMHNTPVTKQGTAVYLAAEQGTWDRALLECSHNTECTEWQHS